MHVRQDPHQGYAPTGYAAWKPPVQRPWFVRHWNIALAVVVPAAIVALVTWQKGVDAKANYVVFDSIDANVRIKIDGKAQSYEERSVIGPKSKHRLGARAPIVANLKQGSHHIEILSEDGKPLEAADITVPAAGYRALYVAGATGPYSLRTVTYGSRQGEEGSTVPLDPGPSPHLWLLPRAPLTEQNDFLVVDRIFPASISTKQSGATLRSLCSTSPDGESGCTFEQPSARPARQGRPSPSAE